MDANCLRALALIAIIALVKLCTVQGQAGNLPPVWDETSVALLTEGINEATSEGTLLVTLKCNDPEGDTVSYKLLKGRAVIIDERTGEVFLRVKLDFEKKDDIGYDLEFGCIDLLPSGSPRHSKYVTLQVDLTVDDANDHAPSFNVIADQGYTFTVSEFVNPGFVLNPPIKLVDLDRTSNAELRSLYLICNSQNPQDLVDLPATSVATCEKFGLNYTQLTEGVYDANLRVLDGESLDFETRAVYSSKIVAIDNPDNPADRLSTTINVQILIQDAQDVNPVFTNPGDSASVLEEGNRGDIVDLAVSARDGDTGDKRPVKIVMFQDDMNAFYFDPSVETLPDSGIYAARLRVNNSLDREQVIGAYSFVVKAIELDKETNAETTATATATYSVLVRDIDDQAPTFEQNTYYIDVNEMEYTKEIVQLTGLRIVCVDEDEPRNARYNVTVVSQPYPDVYSISPGVTFTGTAVLFLQVNDVTYLDYDREEYRTQTLILEAKSVSSSSFSSSTTVSISLLDINDNAPQFEQQSYTLTVREDILRSEMPFPITTIRATDTDSGINGQITYRLEGGSADKFEINPVTGELTLVDKVDYETTPLYVFLVYAEDSAANKQRSQVQVSVSVLNVNDEAPVFQQPVYRSSINEDQLQFLAPIRVSARDDEEGTQRITYSISRGQTPDNAFNLNPNTGELTLNSRLDYGIDGIYLLTVEASDNGNPALYGVAQVEISVIDQNNFPPVINPKEYSFTASEIIAPGTFVATIQGTDADTGEFGRISYRIVSGGFDNFDIDSVTGRITIKDPQNFDFDQQEEYTVQIVGSDGGAPQLTDTATLRVTITDANNKKPAFLRNIYIANVDEKNGPGFPILTVEATDTDSTKNLYYSIDESSMVALNGAGNVILSTTPYNYKEAVAINPTTGLLTVNKRLNKDQLLALSFNVKVEDINAETEGQFDFTRVALTIIGDANRNLTFDPIDQIFVNEGSDTGYEITTVEARDPSNQLGVITYQQMEASAFFEVTSSGQVLLRNKIDYETDSRTHYIPIRAVAEDGIRSVSTTVTIQITDNNDNAPRFLQTEYEATIDEDAQPLTSVIDIAATDSDTASFGPIEYSIVGGFDSDDFELYKTNTGVTVILARGKTLDFNNREFYDLEVMAQDNPDMTFSTVQLSTNVKLKIRVIDTNNHSPQFVDNTVRTFAVAETADTDKSIGTIFASDDDFGVNGEVQYYLQPIDDPTSQTGIRLFEIVPRTGVIKVASSLLGFGGTTFRMQVFARDGGNPFLSNTLGLDIEVLRTETNDGNPVWIFPTSNTVFSIDEEKENVRVTDPFQVTPRTGASVVFSLSALSDSVDSFHINNVTGVITMVKKLDREIKESYNLLVYAEDTSDPLNIRTGQQIIITLNDINDNTPTFTNPNNYVACGPPIERPLEISFHENLPAKSSVFNLTACDADSMDKDKPIYYYAYNGNDYCREQNAAALVSLELMEDGEIRTREVVDYEQTTEFRMCVQALPNRKAASDRKKRSFDMSQVDANLHNVAYILIHVIDENDNKPVFPRPAITAVMVSDARDYPIVVLDANDNDSEGLSNIVYSIVDTLFYPAGVITPTSPGRAFVLKNNELHPDPPRGFTFKDFSGGRFVLTIRAEDAMDSSQFSTQTITIYVHEEGNAMKVILDMKPEDGYNVGRTVVRNLDAVSADYIFHYLHVSVHTNQDGIDTDKTDVCFIAVNGNSHNILNVLELVTLLDKTKYQDVLNTAQYQTLDRGKCYPSKSSEDQIKWKDLWWVLVIVAIFIGVCSLVFILIILALYRKYKRYMKSERTYLVPQ